MVCSERNGTKTYYLDKLQLLGSPPERKFLMKDDFSAVTNHIL